DLADSIISPVGEHREVGETEVDPHLGDRLRKRLVVDFDNERGEAPAGRVLDDRDGRWFGRERARPADGHLAHPRHVQPAACADGEAVAGEPDRLPVVLTGPELGWSELRPLALAGDRSEERPIRYV